MEKRILILDNYDSFTYNLFHLIQKITDSKIDVIRNDKIELDDVIGYDKIILSPGPGIPLDAGLLIPLIQRFAATKSILGVCLGHQAIAQALGGQIVNLKTVFHGVATTILQEEQAGSLFNGLPKTFKAGRYHSWVIDELNLPSALIITARDEWGVSWRFNTKRMILLEFNFTPNQS